VANKLLEATRSPETSVLTRPTRRHIPEDGVLHSHRRDLTSYERATVFSVVTCAVRPDFIGVSGKLTASIIRDCSPWFAALPSEKQVEFCPATGSRHYDAGWPEGLISSHLQPVSLSTCLVGAWQAARIGNNDGARGSRSPCCGCQCTSVCTFPRQRSVCLRSVFYEKKVGDEFSPQSPSS
jgi:hypothetical protein